MKLHFNYWIVWWKDAYVTLDPPEADTKLTITIGAMIKEDDLGIYLSNYWDGVAETFDVPITYIPKLMIQHVEVIYADGNRNNQHPKALYSRPAGNPGEAQIKNQRVGQVSNKNVGRSKRNNNGAGR